MALFRKCLAEFVGTFALVFAGCGAIIANEITGGSVTHVGIALTFGLTIMVMVYAVGHISGGHFNPAVSVAFGLTTRFPKSDMVAYVVAQCLGAVTASLCHKAALSSFFTQVTNNPMIYGVTLPVDGQFMTAFVFEVITTFFLMFVILSVATDKRAVGTAAGVAIGGTIALDALFAGPISGASMNPARSFGPALMQGEWSTFSAYVVGPILGAALGAIVYKIVGDLKNQTECAG